MVYIDLTKTKMIFDEIEWQMILERKLQLFILRVVNKDEGKLIER